MLIEKNDTVYRSGDIVVQERPTQDVIGAAYLRAKADGLLQAFFHEADEPMSLFEFLNWAMEKDSVLYGAFQTTRCGYQVVGFGKLQVPKPAGAGRYKSEVAMLFFREFQQRSVTIPACSLMLEMIFDRTNVNVVYGSIPEHNHASRRFMKAIGFRFLPEPIPHYTSWKGKPCGMTVSWMTEEMWRNRS